MNIERLAVTVHDRGGNPAGVVFCDFLPGADEMESLAANIGYSETLSRLPHLRVTGCGTSLQLRRLCVASSVAAGVA